MENYKEWWDLYVPFIEGSMVRVPLENGALQNKMKLANMKICEDCNRREGIPLFRIAGEVMNCPIHGKIDLCSMLFLPSDCPYKLEHIVSFQEL